MLSWCFNSKIVYVPIGQISGEAQEARNKDIKNYKENFSRKRSKININTDIFQRLLLSLDPFISSINYNNNKNKRRKKLLLCVKNLLIAFENKCDSDSNCSSPDGSSDEYSE
jgi:hypothetical protein